MAGTRGPIPKRSDQRVRRNKDNGPVDKVTAIGHVPIPELTRTDDLPIHPLVTDLYESMKDSAQRQFFEPSDWQYARLTLHFVNKLLWTRPSAEMLATVNSMLTSLLMTEGDRRRVRLEIERNPGDDQDAEVVSIADMFKARLGAK